MKQILYDTVSQTMVNRAVHSKERREQAWAELAKLSKSWSLFMFSLD